MTDEEKDKTFQMRVSDTFLRQIDEWRRSSSDLPSRAEAVRRLIQAGLGKVGTETFNQYEAEIEGLRRVIEALEKGWIGPVQWVGHTGSVEDAVTKYNGQIRTLQDAQSILAEGAARRLDAMLEQRGYQVGR